MEAGPTQSGAPPAPSRSTVYVSNLPFSLTNSDVFKIFEKFGKLIKVTIMRDKATRRSRGVAFLLYLSRPEALACVAATHGCLMFGRTLAAHMAKDNGRAADFVRRREYPDKSRCFECGEFGHLSYACSKNTLGGREIPKKKAKKKKRPSSDDSGPAGCKKTKSEATAGEDESSEASEDDESLSAAIRYTQQLRAAESGPSCSPASRKKAYRPSSYFSDEEDLE